MLSKFLKKINPFSQPDRSIEQWRIQLLNSAHSPSERAEVDAIFAARFGF